MKFSKISRNFPKIMKNVADFEQVLLLFRLISGKFPQNQKYFFKIDFSREKKEHIKQWVPDFCGFVLSSVKVV